MVRKNMTSLRNPRGGREKGTVIPDNEGNAWEGLKIKSRRTRTKGGKAAETDKESE